MIKNCWNKLQKKQSLSKDFIEETDENSSAKNSLLFNLVINRSLNVRTEPLPADTIYFAQNKIIKELAGKKSCVIVGRCSDYILRDREDCLNVLQKEYQGSLVLCYQSS